jgi:hypothetical protein
VQFEYLCEIFKFRKVVELVVVVVMVEVVVAFVVVAW